MAIIPGTRETDQGDFDFEASLGKGSKIMSQKQNKQALVAPTCNPSYSGGRDQEAQGSKPAWKNNSRDPISKILIMKRDWWSGSRCRP
jgi:hypothetical protein